MTDLEEKIKKFVEANEIKYFETDNDFQMNCFSCDDVKQRLGVSKKTGAWSCLNGGCGIKGTKFKNLLYGFNQKNNTKSAPKVEEKEKEEVSKLKPEFHLPYADMLQDGEFEDAYNYLLEDRGLSEECIEHFKLGVRWEFKKRTGGNYDATDHVVIPYIQDDKCVNVKYRKITLKDKSDAKWRREVGGISALFNVDVTKDHDYDWIVITESEIDAMSVWSHGIKNVVGLTVGAKGFKSYWSDYLSRYKRIYLLLDNDEAGQEGARALADRLGLGRCFNVTLPDDVKDPNDYIKKYSLKDLENLLDTGERFSIPKVKSAGQLADESFHRKFVAKEQAKEKTFDTPWPKINRILGPAKEGFLFVLAGKPKSGKTTLALNLMEYWGRGHKISSAIYSCEMRGERLYDKWAMMKECVYPKPEEMDELAHLRASVRLPLERMFTFEPTEQEELAIEGVVANVEAIIDRYGTKVVVVDNLHYLCRGENENALISVATQQLKLLAERKNVLLIAVTHPRKTNNNKQLTTDDLKGSSTIFQDADVIWLMHRLANNGNLLPEELEAGGDGALSPLAEILITGRFTDGGKGALALIGARSMFLDRGRTFRKLISNLVKKTKKKKGKGF